RSRSALSVEGRSTHRLAALVGVGAGRVFDRGRPAPVMPLGAPLFLAALVVQSGPSDSLRFTAMRLPESALVLETRARPFAVRDAISDALGRGELDAARRIAAAYAVAWRDSFLVREVERFAAWPLERRAAKVWADSARRAGIAAAQAGYVRALGLRERIGDTRGAAADRNNLGLLAQTAGDLHEARRQFEAALALNRHDGRDEVAATNLVNLAGLASVDGDF